MPSIKTCIITIALAAFSFASVEASTSTMHSGVVARDSMVKARSANPSAGVSRRAAAAKALRKRAAAAAAEAANPYSKNSAFLNTKAALAAAKVRCGTDTVCERRTTAAPANGAAVCITGKCTYRCNDGYAPGGTDGTQCVAAASACSGVTCADVTNGYNTCDATGACSPGCNAGLTLYQASNGAYACFDTTSDAANCGTPGNVCPSSYNGIGTSTCTSSTCKVACPPGYFLRKAQSTTNPYYCYNGEDSLR
ncbi:hypothetical protein JCM21900_004655 [Sporobolomyces salmonicolor]